MYIRKSDIILSVCGFLSSNLPSQTMSCLKCVNNNETTTNIQAMYILLVAYKSPIKTVVESKTDV